MMIIEGILTGDRRALKPQVIARARQSIVVELHVTLEALGAGVVLNRLDIEAELDRRSHRAAARDLYRPRHHLRQGAGAAREVVVTRIDRRNIVAAYRKRRRAAAGRTATDDCRW